MSYLLSSVHTKEDFTTSSSYSLGKKKYRNILKPKENTYKHRCSRALKNKLKKYKLRHDGNEDQDVLDVSQILIKSLNIKSPTSKNNNKNNNCIFDESYPRNYLFKMGRRKIIKPNENADLSSSDKNVDSLPPHCEGKEKQQTNAFKLLMDSRNKSIGSNSPGKEKSVNENEDEEMFEKKTIKAKRNLALQKLAESKGSLKKKELEEYQEYCIKKKMEKRAERLKTMIETNIKNTKTEKTSKRDSQTKSSEKSASDLIKQEEVSSKKSASDVIKQEVSKQKALTLISLFNDPVIGKNMSPKKKMVSEEDKDFLKKLSPSLKKKENMLCYFKKVDKENPLSTDVENTNCNINDDVVIKVKLSSKLKKKAKKKKFSTSDVNSENSKSESVSIDCNIGISSDIAVDNQQSESNTNKDRRKRKRNDVTDNNILSTNDLLASERRPKRNIKKPVKYIDEVDVFSSDDDLHIFTPKKKRNGETKTPIKQTIKINHDNKNNSAAEIEIKPEKSDVFLKSKPTVKVEKKSKKVLHKIKSIEKKIVKLAPIFAAKPQLDPIAVEAKQRFLHSGVPDKLKKIISDQKNTSVGQCLFPITVHIQQNKHLVSHLPKSISLNIPYQDVQDVSDEHCILLEDNLFKKIIDPLLDKREVENDGMLNYNKHTILQNIKKIYPKFPVFRTYRLLKEKKCGELKDCSFHDLDNSIEVIYGINDLSNENPDNLNWTDKYKATSSKHIIGNFESIKELRKWLVTWTENQIKSRNKINFESDSSDFYQSDTDSKESFKMTNNLLMITGPVGCGKTSGVYAVAAELAIKVIEVNASSKRTGKIMLQDLQEATQSHKVNRGKSSAENSQKSQEITEDNIKTLTKRGRPKKRVEKPSTKTNMSAVNIDSTSQPTSQENARTEMSLILIDDADIVFEQDDGFCSAIVQLVQSSKRPVILISSSASCTHLQKFSQSAKIINMHPLQPKMLGTWLDIMSLADGGVCVPGTGAKILDFFKGDIRKAINSLQFFVFSQIQPENEKESNTPNSDTVPYVDDENSNMSWAEHDNNEDKLLATKNVDYVNNRLCKQIIGPQLTFSQYNRPLELFNIWWSLPRLVINPINFELLSRQNNDKHLVNNQPTVVALEVIANVMESVSIAEYYRPAKPAKTVDVTCHPWFSVECDSVSETEHSYDYNRNEEVIEDISHNFVSGSILEARKLLKVESSDMHFPSMTEQRERDKIVSRHHNLSSCLNPTAVLDRKALALDYWSYCRTICRIEKSKTDINLKRKNRFCHYLKSLNVMCKSDYFDKLADSLYTSRGAIEELIEIE